MTPSDQKKRKTKFIEPRIQMRFILAFTCTAGLAVLVQSNVVAYALSSIAAEAPHDQDFLLAAIPRVQTICMLATLGVLLPLAVTVGVYMTFPIVGPIYRFREYFTGVISGQETEPCSIRKTDELQELCTIINQVVEPTLQKNRARVGLEKEGSQAA